MAARFLSAKVLSARAIAAVAAMIAVVSASPVAGSDGARPAARSELRDLLWPAPGMGARRDQHARPLAPAALDDKVVVVAFVSADCSITCVLRTQELARVADSLPEALRERVVVLGVDTDPVRDDAARLQAFADAFVGARTRMRLLLSAPAETAALSAALRYPASALPEPPAAVLLFDRRGQVAMTYGGDRLDGERLLRDIAVLETFDQGLEGPAEAAATAATRF